MYSLYICLHFQPNRYYGQLHELSHGGRGRSGRAVGRGLHIRAAVFLRPTRRNGHRPGEYRLLQGRHALLRDDCQATVTARQGRHQARLFGRCAAFGQRKR